MKYRKLFGTILYFVCLAAIPVNIFIFAVGFYLKINKLMDMALFNGLLCFLGCMLHLRATKE